MSRSKTLKQLLYGSEVVGVLVFADVAVITLAAFFVVSDTATARSTVKETVLEAVSAWRKRALATPRRQLQQGFRRLGSPLSEPAARPSCIA